MRGLPPPEFCRTCSPFSVSSRPLSQMHLLAHQQCRFASRPTAGSGAIRIARSWRHTLRRYSSGRLAVRSRNLKGSRSQLTQNSSKIGSPTGNRAWDAGRDFSEVSELAKNENDHILLMDVSCQWSVVRCRRRMPDTANPDRSSTLRMTSFPWARIRLSGGLHSSGLDGSIALTESRRLGGRADLLDCSEGWRRAMPRSSRIAAIERFVFRPIPSLFGHAPQIDSRLHEGANCHY